MITDMLVSLGDLYKDVGYWTICTHNIFLLWTIKRIQELIFEHEICFSEADNAQLMSW